MPKIGKNDSDVVDRFMPPPLLLDDSGREVDVFGNVVKKKKALVATTMINKKLQRETVNILNIDNHPSVETDPTKNPFYDPAIKLIKVKRAKRDFHFVEAGTFVKKSQKIRAKAVQDQVLSAEIIKPEEKVTEGEAVTAVVVKEKKLRILCLRLNGGMHKS